MISLSQCLLLVLLGLCAGMYYSTLHGWLEGFKYLNQCHRLCWEYSNQKWWNDMIWLTHHSLTDGHSLLYIVKDWLIHWDKEYFEHQGYLQTKIKLPKYSTQTQFENIFSEQKRTLWLSFLNHNATIQNLTAAYFDSMFNL